MPFRGVAIPLNDIIFSEPSMGVASGLLPFFAGKDTTDAATNDFLIVRGKIQTVVYAPALDQIV